MGRPKRADEAGGIYHALNRGNGGWHWQMQPLRVPRCLWPVSLMHQLHRLPVRSSQPPDQRDRLQCFGCQVAAGGLYVRPVQPADWARA
ncbi:hypothetical protein DTL42_13485 [Bremerella cremea]|uniref:Uncharacterized protein n=1 Tax=Bremerella cremea TaxID=1031537 RepID=A0A368KQF6_9BACT|nr:hypothetical protein DTL42_13485 [Bremerella cremea]